MAVGEKIVHAGVNLRNLYGGTEFGAPVVQWYRIPRTIPDVDWFWYRFDEDANVRFESQGDGTFELVVIVSITSIMP